MENCKTIFDAAEDVLEILGSQRIEAVVIGAVALAAYRYVRQTQDLDHHRKLPFHFFEVVYTGSL